MRLFRHGPAGEERPGIIDASGTRRDLSAVVDDIAGEVLSEAGLARLREIDASSLPEVSADVRFGPCVGDVINFICIGLNYTDHAAEAGMQVPETPIFFLKATSAISGPFDDIVLPRGSVKTDWEVELGIIVGRGGTDIEVKQAMEHVAGYCVVNDLSERQLQFENAGQWVMGKSCPGFGPVGPYLVTRDEVPEPGDLGLWLEVDGHRFQDGRTANMVFGAAEIISYLSSKMLLCPGDIIATGTPPGVGMGLRPEPVYLSGGQTVVAGIEGLGAQKQKVVAPNGR